jgi:hypothetical protein
MRYRRSFTKHSARGRFHSPASRDRAAVLAREREDLQPVVAEAADEELTC